MFVLAPDERRSAAAAAGDGRRWPGRPASTWPGTSRGWAGRETARTVRALAGSLAGVGRLVVGDPFSGVIQVVLVAWSRAEEVVIVDDGTATMEFARQWLAGENLSRWHQRATAGQRRQIVRFARDQISASVRRRLGPGSACRLSAFSCLPVDLGSSPVVANTYAWTKRRFPRADRQAGRRPGRHLAGRDRGRGPRGLSRRASRCCRSGTASTATSPTARSPTSSSSGSGCWAADRPAGAARWRSRPGRRGRRPGDQLPSTVVHTLPLALSDTAAEVVVCDIGADWLTSGGRRPAPTIPAAGELHRPPSLRPGRRRLLMARQSLAPGGADRVAGCLP